MFYAFYNYYFTKNNIIVIDKLYFGKNGVSIKDCYWYNMINIKDSR